MQARALWGAIIKRRASSFYIPIKFDCDFFLSSGFFSFCLLSLVDLVQCIHSLDAGKLNSERAAVKGEERARESKKYEENSNSYWKVHFNLWTYLHIRCKQKGKRRRRTRNGWWSHYVIVEKWTVRQRNKFISNWIEVDAREENQLKTKRRKSNDNKEPKSWNLSAENV